MIPVEALAEFAGLFDRFANHLDPLSDDWKQRKKITTLRSQIFIDDLARMSSVENFRREAQRACFRWLRSQDKPSTPPPKA